VLVTIGLEVHVQLRSRTKIFCGCAVQFGGEPNSAVCPVCLGLPGALPVLNREVFGLGLRAVLAMGGKPSEKIKFDRKNYFYPDLPKGYQISQYDAPLGRGGSVELDSGKKIRIHRAHLEEDAGKLIHDQSPESSFVDLNRAGTPLIEIVSEPDLESPEEAYEYLLHLKTLLKAVKVSECDMEKGHLRCDANVSVRKNSADPLGKKVEIKNLNSFRAVKVALDYEIKRQTEAFQKGEGLFQETRLWDDARQRTETMRSKEEAHDYRYFPEPDLVPFSVSEKEVELARHSLPELPREKRLRFVRDYALSEYDARLLTDAGETAELFETAAKQYRNPKTIAHWITGPGFAYAGAHNVELSRTKLTADALVKLCRLVESGKISLQAAKEKVFPVVLEEGLDPEAVIQDRGLEQVSEDSALLEWIREAIEANPKVVQDFKSGKDTAAMFLVGQVMKKSRGAANPIRVQELLRQKLSKHAPS
jgi:aspartyl-tRNA(Asn)/glutamyl-tRNA(Gln) amidotransferase subunit B